MSLPINEAISATRPGTRPGAPAEGNNAAQTTTTTTSSLTEPAARPAIDTTAPRDESHDRQERRSIFSRKRDDSHHDQTHEEDKTEETSHESSSSATEPDKFYYDKKIELPRNTNHAVDQAVANLSRTYLQGEEVRRMAWARPLLPFLTGIGVGILKPWNNIIAGLGVNAAVTGILSPVTSMIRRVTGENAFSQFARFANRAEENNLGSRLIHGGESRAVKAFFLKEDRDIRQLLRIKEQGTDLNNIGIGSRDRIESLIASGVMAGMKIQMIGEHGVQLSDNEKVKIARLQEAYQMSKTLMDARIPKGGQQEIFINDVLPNLVRKKERELWLKQTAGITGVGLLKSSAMVLLGNVFTFTNINGLLGHIGDAVGRVGKGLANLNDSVLVPAFSNAMMIPHNLKTWVDYYGYNASTWVAKALNQPYPIAPPGVLGFKGNPMSTHDALMAVK